LRARARCGRSSRSSRSRLAAILYMYAVALVIVFVGRVTSSTHGLTEPRLAAVSELSSCSVSAAARAAAHGDGPGGAIAPYTPGGG
jgi:hypothetical protein